MEKQQSVLDEQIHSAKKSWLILYPVDVAVTAYFAILIFGVASAYIAGKNYFELKDIAAAIGSFSIATIFIFISILFGWGTTHTEKTMHMDEKKGNDYVVIVLIILTGVIAAGARYIHTQKTEYTNALEYLSKHNAEYMNYMGQLNNNYDPDDAGARQAMKEMREDYVKSQTSAGDTYSTFYEIPFACLLAVLINFCFGAMVTKYYRLRRSQEENQGNVISSSPPPSYTPDDFEKAIDRALNKRMDTPPPVYAKPLQDTPAKPGNGVSNSFKITPGFEPPQYQPIRAEDKSQSMPQPEKEVVYIERPIYLGPDIQHARDEKLRQAQERFEEFKQVLRDDPGQKHEYYADKLKCDRSLISKMLKAIREGKSWPQNE